MSQIMIHDELQMEGVNPFWDEPPGAWSTPHKYAPTVQNTIEREPEQIGSDNRGVEYKCPLNRPLYPRINIDDGLWSLITDMKQKVNKRENFFPIIIFIIIFIMLIDYLL